MKTVVGILFLEFAVGAGKRRPEVDVFGSVPRCDLFDPDIEIPDGFLFAEETFIAPVIVVYRHYRLDVEARVG